MKIHLKISIILFFFLSLLSSLPAANELKDALFYQKLDNKNVQCQLCPRRCFITADKRGFCGVRENQGGTLYTLVYAKPVAIHIDPIEKKPLFHFLPSTTAFSIATAGCNLRCKFCQNWEISQARPEELEYVYIEPKDLVKKVKESGSPTIAYTYTEPTIFYEYMLETAKLAKKEGLRNIMHSNGYINEAPLRQLCKYLDAANIDLKGFSDEFYAKLTDATLEPVLKSLKVLREEGVYVEITNLILPGFNDDEALIKKMCLWIKDNLGPDTPVHFGRFFPLYKLTSLNPTPVETLEKARAIALDCGLKYVYIGNVAGHPAENTYCPRCKKVVIERKGYFVTQNNLEGGKCKFCQEEIKGVWK
jgi:pyruvate formate lyase activating enzyme